MDEDLVLVKSLVNNGAFGSVRYVTSDLEKDIDKGTQFASVINFVKITVNNGSKNIDYHIVIKKKHGGNEAKDLFNSDVAFNNEMIMYKKILPLLEVGKLNLFPKLYQGISSNKNDENSTLIFENLQYDGYMVTKEMVFIDYEHIEMALRKLGEFHALSYLAKQQHKEQFFKLANDLIETKFTTGKFATKDNLIFLCMKRGIQPLLEQHIEVDLLNKVINKLDNTIAIAQALLIPEEPFSVVCHGDFCRNNMFFKYDKNKPIDIKFFDLQNSLYTSPAVDLSFFLYMNTTVEMRDKYWDKFLNIYWNAVSDSVPNLEFTFEQFLEHFAKRAIYGYFPTCFFLPTSIADENEQLAIEEFVLLTMEERTQRMLLLAGDRGTKVITDIVKHLLNKNYLQKFLEL